MVWPWAAVKGSAQVKRERTIAERRRLCIGIELMEHGRLARERFDLAAVGSRGEINKWFISRFRARSSIRVVWLAFCTRLSSKCGHSLVVPRGAFCVP